MRANSKRVVAAATLCACLSGALGAQSGEHVLAARHATRRTAFKVFLPNGRLRIVAWDRDSVVVRGHPGRGEGFYFGGDTTGIKFGMEPRYDDDKPGSSPASSLVVYLPRRSMMSAKTATASIDATGVSGWFYSVSGAIRLSGAATSIEAESMTGDLDLNVATPYLKARTGDGHLLLRGTPEDVDVGTIGGTLDIATSSPRRGVFGTVSGAIHYAAAPATGGIFEFSSHSGAVELLLPPTVSGLFTLSSITGRIDNGIAAIHPVSAGGPHSMRLTAGTGGATITVRTFKGTIRLRN